MAQIATVTSLAGKAYVVGVDGSVRQARLGEAIQKGEVVRTEAGANVELTMLDGQKESIAAEQSVRVDEHLVNGEGSPAAQESAVATGTIENVIQALEQGGDLTQELEAAAAGGGAGGGGDGSSFVRLLRVAEGVDPLAFNYSFELSSIPEELLLGAGAPATATPTPDTPTAERIVGGVTLHYIQLDEGGKPVIGGNGGFVYIDGKDVIEGTPVGLVAEVDVAPTGSDLVLNLSTGDSITIPVGGLTSGFIPVEIRGDDLYVQGPDQIDVSITGASGGQYDELSINQTTSFNVVDDQDTTTVKLGDVTVDEGSGTATISASVDHAVTGSDLVLTLSNGATVTIEVGKTTGTSSAFAVQGDDVYKDGDSYSVSISDAKGGNYEKLDTSATATVTVNDTIDTTTATLTTSTTQISETGGSIVYTVTLSGDGAVAPKTDLTFTLANGEEVTIKAGDLSGSSTSTYSDADITNQQAIANSIKEVTSGGSEYENLVTTGSTAVDVGYAPSIVSASGEGSEDSSGIAVSISANDNNDTGGSVSGYVIQSLPTHGTLYIVDGNTKTAVTEGAEISASDAGKLSFVPDHDWSGTTSFDLVAVDNQGMQSAMTTADIVVTPVTDAPTVEVSLTPVVNFQAYAADLAAVASGMTGQGSHPAGFSITALKDGAQADIAIKDTGTPTGFGVAGQTASGGDVELGKGESLLVSLDAPASNVTFELAWLNSFNETAVYKVSYSDGTSAVFSISGGTDGVDAPVTTFAPTGTSITSIEFSTPTEGDRAGTSDYMLHSISYETAVTTYTVDITATPTDVDFSEDIVQLKVTTTEGVTLSDAKFEGAENGVSTWTLLVSGDNAYTGPTVSVDADTGVVTVSGLTLTVPSGLTGLSVTATAVARDGAAAEVSASDTVSMEGPSISLSGTHTVQLEESFENLVPAGQSWAMYSGGAFNGDHGNLWTTDGAGLEVQANGVGGANASDGKVKAELDSHSADGSNTLVKLSTHVELSGGDATLSFDYSPRPGHESDSGMRVTLTDATGQVVYQGDYTNADTLGWKSFTVDISADSVEAGTYTLTFQGLGASDSYGAYLDNIKVVDAGANYTAAYVEGNSPVSIAGHVTISDADDTELAGAVIRLTNPQADDVLSVGALPTGVSYEVSADGFTITLSGGASLADYQHAIEAITFENTSADPSTSPRVIEVTVSDGVLTSDVATTTIHVVALEDVDSVLGGDDIIHGTSGPDVLYSGAGNDQVWGEAGNDILIGGAGNDTLIGGDGADVFKWSLSDQGSADAPAVDHIADFNKAEGDVLDLRDLLQGESESTLTQYLTFGEEGGKAVLSVSATPDGDVTQKIVFDNHSLVSLEQAFGASDADNLIAQMKSSGNLNVD